ncbi:hypothetical protein F8M41_008229 [Gigaspora margarita]|uniref:Uncharacterized protein n=1 Tax=Gigaspora margarita TaxID=4874 RepID=A0A8H4A4R1_GIGMA|nr:hypothetical protein F8M41_008229 [Gigaspora margarita]
MNFKRRACGYGSGNESEAGKVDDYSDDWEKLLTLRIFLLMSKSISKSSAFHLLLICHHSLTEECTHGLEMSEKAKASKKICFELCASYRYWDARSYLLDKLKERPKHPMTYSILNDVIGFFKETIYALAHAMGAELIFS